MEITDNNGNVWNVYYPDASSALTPEGILSRLLTVDGPGSGLNADFLDGESGSYFLAGGIIGIVDVCNPDYGVAGDGSDESAKVQAAFDAAAALRSGSGRPLVRIPPGKTVNIGTANLTLLDGIDLDMRGACLVSSVATGAALSIGADGYFNPDVVAFGVRISRSYAAIGDAHLSADTIGVRFINAYRPTVQMAPVEGFRRCVQFRASWGTAKQAGYCFEGNIHLSRMSGKYMLSLLNADRYDVNSGSWVNAMRFHGGDFTQLYTPVNTIGRTAGVIYELGLDPTQMPIDGQALQNNVFDSPVFQLGGGSEPAFSSGGTVPADRLGACYVDGGYSYICTQTGTFGTTALSALSKVPGATITSGTTTWTVEGKYVRSPFIFDKCGQSMTCREPYWETGVGPFMHFIGKTAGAGHRVSGVFLGGPVSGLSRFVGDRDGDRDSWDWSIVTYVDSWSKLNNIVEMGSQVGQTVQISGINKQILRSADWHRRFIKGQTNWQAPGLSARYTDNIYDSLAADYRLGDGCIITNGGGSLQFGVLIPTDQYKRFRVTVDHRSGDTVFASMAIIGFDANLTPIDLGTSTTQAPDIMADRGSLQAVGSIHTMVTSPNDWEFWLAVADNIKFIHISNSWGNAGDAMDGIEVEAILDTYLTRAKPLAFKEPFSSSIEGRRSDGTPTQGYFLTQGEYINNSASSGVSDSVNGWVVSTSGILAPAWANSTAVYKGELRSSNGNVYAANSAFTTGATAPSGTGTSISDGGGTWKYVAPVAVLSQVIQYKPHDTRSDLDYTPYDVFTATLGTDSNADGLSDGVTTHTYGTQTGITYSYSVATHQQNFSIARASGSATDAGERVAFSASMANGKEYFLLLEAHVACSVSSAEGFIVGLLDTTNVVLYDISSTFYAPDGYPQDVLGKADSSGNVVLANRFTAPSVDANLYGIYFEPGLWDYPPVPQTIDSYVANIWLIDIAAAETALGISLAGLSSGELYAIIEPALKYVPPTYLHVSDVTTSAKRSLSVNSGAFQVDGVTIGGGGGSVAWGGITGTLSSQTDLDGALSGKEASITAGTTGQYWRGDKSWQTLESAALSDFNSASRAQTEAELVAGTNITLTPSGSGATRQITISASGGGGGSSALSITSISADTLLDSTYLAKYVILTGSTDRTLTFSSAATLGEGWNVIVSNTGTAKWAINETIDGVSPVSSVAFHVLPGEVRQIRVESGAFKSRVLAPFNMDILSSITLPMPSGYSVFYESYATGGGGGGAKGGGAGTTVGGAGGGGSFPFGGIRVPAAGTAITFTIGAGGAAGATTSSNGGVGGTTSVSWSGGPAISGYGGGGGGYGGGSGGGGSWLGAATSGNSTNAGAGGDPASNYGIAASGGPLGLANGVTKNGYHSSHGGGSGGCGGGGGYAGGSSLYGGAGGGNVGSGGAVGNPGTSFLWNASAGTSSASGTATTGTGPGCAGGGTASGTAAPGADGGVRLSALPKAQ